MKVIVDSRVDFLKDEFRRATIRAIEEAQAATIAAAQPHTPVDTGELAGGFYAVGVVAGETSIRGTVVNGVAHARFQEFGTLGRRTKALSPKTIARRSSASGQKRLAKVAGHPGVEAHHFLRDGARAGRRVFFASLQRLAPR